jgi:hypothetical protein
MGWFRTGNGDDVIGDMAADIIGTVLTDYVAGGSKPSLSQVLNALEVTLRGHEARFLDQTTAAGSIGRLVRRGSEPLAEASAPAALIDAAGDMMDRLTRVYEDTCERKPRLTEVLASLIFAFQGEGASVLADPGDPGLHPGDLIEIPPSRMA